MIKGDHLSADFQKVNVTATHHEVDLGTTTVVAVVVATVVDTMIVVVATTTVIATEVATETGKSHTRHYPIRDQSIDPLGMTIMTITAAIVTLTHITAATREGRHQGGGGIRSGE